MTAVNVQDILNQAKSSGNFWEPDAGAYDVEIVGYLDSAEERVAAFFKVLTGPNAGNQFLQNYGDWGKNTRESTKGAAGLAVKRWLDAGISEEFLSVALAQEPKTTIRLVKAALLGVKLNVTLAPQKKKPEYNEITLNKTKLIERPALPDVNALLAGAPAAPAAPAVPTPAAAPATPTASAPATAPAAVPTPAAAPAAPAEDPQVAALKAQLAALEAQAAAQSSPNGAVTGVPAVPAPAVGEEDPGF